MNHSIHKPRSVIPERLGSYGIAVDTVENAVSLFTFLSTSQIESFQGVMALITEFKSL